MVLENDIPRFSQWFASALPIWLLIMFVLTVGSLAFIFLVGSAVHGPMRMGDAMFRTLKSAIWDLAAISPRRVWALARLAIQEAMRRRVWVSLIMFVVILMFALWFLDSDSPDPASLYLDFVLTATSYLVLLMAVFLSAFSLPTDLKNKTITTVVTKPVRPSEIILGRILGFVGIGTGLLAVMAVVSYLFVVRALYHTHELNQSDLTAVEAPAGAEGPQVLQGRTEGLVQHHYHSATITKDDSGTSGATDVVQRHFHDIEIGERDGKPVYTLSGPKGMFQARVPVYGGLRFKDRAGADVRQGVNVGNEWTYRSYVEGGSLAAAIWTFQGITPEEFPDGLRLQMTIRVFRTYKGDVTKPVVGSIVLRNPRTGLRSSPRNFANREYSIDEKFIPRELQDSAGKSIDLFDDLVDNGEVEVWLQCIERGQYFGMAKPDVYLMAREGNFELNFLKGFVTIWLQLAVITTFGVMWSTFLNGSVAMLATLTTLVGGFFVEFMSSLAAGETLGGGTFESAMRMFNGRNILTELDPSVSTTIIHSLDKLVTLPLTVVARMVPNFKGLSDVSFVSYGYDIPMDLLLTQIFTSLGYILPVFLVGFIIFKLREVAK